MLDPDNDCNNSSPKCAKVKFDAAEGAAWARLELSGTGANLSTILFMIDKWYNTDGYLNFERWYGSNIVYNGVGNTEIIQSGGTNYPSMVADLNDGGGPILVKYIHLRADNDFGLNEIYCYEY